MKKIIVIIGPGTSGKGTFIKVLRLMLEEQYPVFTFSSIFPIKDKLVKDGHWDGKTKDEESRNKMIDLKMRMISDGDQPMRYLIDKISEIKLDEYIVFIHIREADEIEKFLKVTKDELNIEATTLHYDRAGKEDLNTTAETQTREYIKYDYDYLVPDGIKNVIRIAEEFLKSIGVDNYKTNIKLSRLGNDADHIEYDDELRGGYA